MKSGHSRKAGLPDQASFIVFGRYDLGPGDTTEDLALEKTIALWQAAVALEPRNPRRDGEIHKSLGNGFNKRYHARRNLDDLKQAIIY